jgi:hypothetical protein
MSVDFAVLFLGVIVFLLVSLSQSIHQRHGHIKSFKEFASTSLFMIPALLVGVWSYFDDLSGDFTAKLSAAREYATSVVPVWDAAFWAMLIGPTEWLTFVQQDIWQRDEVLLGWFSLLLLAPVTLGILVLRGLGKRSLPLLISMAPLIFLFVALDYGRWLMLLSFTVVVGSLAIGLKGRGESRGFSGRHNLIWTFAITLVLTIYVAGWHVPVCCLNEETVSVFHPNLITTTLDSILTLSGR